MQYLRTWRYNWFSKNHSRWAFTQNVFYGYCSHIIADIQNNIKIWIPFQLENKEALEKGIGGTYHQESNDMDYALYLSITTAENNMANAWRFYGYDISNVVGLSEINKMKHSILNNQFIDRKHHINPLLPKKININKKAFAWICVN